MKKIILLLALSLFTISSYADEVEVYYTYGTTSQVNSARLNGNISNILTQVNGNLTNENAATSSGFRFYEALSANPSASPEGRMVYNTAEDILYASNGTSFVAMGPGATKALDNLASVAVNTTISSDTDSTDDLGTSSISWANTYTDAVHLNKIGTNTLYVGTGGDYTTISLAMTAASAGDTILVAEGTYTETVTCSQDNITIKALGSAENTIVTQTAAGVVNFSTKSGCTFDGFTLSLTNADAETDYVIASANDSTTDFNTVKNCIIIWADADPNSACVSINLTDGRHIFRDNRMSFTLSNATATASGWTACINDGTTAGEEQYFIDNVITVTDDSTSTTATCFSNSDVANTQYWYGNTVTMTTAHATTSVACVFKGETGATGRFTGNTVTLTNSSTGIARIFQTGADTWYLTGNTLNSTTSDSDAQWFGDGSTGTLYATGNTITGNCAYNAPTTAIYMVSNSINGDLINGGGDKLATATEVGAMFWDGIVIGTDNDNNILDDATHGSGVGVLYLGNATVDATFTGFHYYQLGDTDLKAGELVCLKNGKLYRSTKKQDPTAIGLFCGLSNWKDSLGNELVDGEEIEETYYDEKEKKEKTRKKKDYGKSVNKKTNKPAKADDYSYSVAITGDSMHNNETNPLNGAWVTTSAGNIKDGDLLCSSAKSGYLELQPDDVMHSYTVAQARENINSDKKDAYIYLLK